MKALQIIRKWLLGIDSHKWESKIEIMTNLSCRHC